MIKALVSTVIYLTYPHIVIDFVHKTTLERTPFWLPSIVALREIPRSFAEVTKAFAMEKHEFRTFK